MEREGRWGMGNGDKRPLPLFPPLAQHYQKYDLLRTILNRYVFEEGIILKEEREVGEGLVILVSIKLGPIFLLVLLCLHTRSVPCVCSFSDDGMGWDCARRRGGGRRRGKGKGAGGRGEMETRRTNEGQFPLQNIHPAPPFFPPPTVQKNRERILTYPFFFPRTPLFAAQTPPFDAQTPRSG